MKKADASGATYAVIIGPDELAKNEAQLKDLRSSGKQKAVALDSVVDAVIDAIVGATDAICEKRLKPRICAAHSASNNKIQENMGYGQNARSPYQQDSLVNC
jgi:hypothetical protein